MWVRNMFMQRTLVRLLDRQIGSLCVTHRISMLLGRCQKSMHVSDHINKVYTTKDYKSKHVTVTQRSSKAWEVHI